MQISVISIKDSQKMVDTNVIIHQKKKKRLEKLSENCTKIHMKFQQTFCLYFLFADFGPIEIPPAPESVASYEVNGPRLMISKIVNENFKSYAGVQTLGPFHKV